MMQALEPARKKLKLYLHTALTAKTLEMEVDPNDSIESVKAVIEEKEGTPNAQQQLVFSGQVLKDGLLSEYNVEEGDTIVLKPMQICIKTPTGRVSAPKPIVISH